jgi:hypothetical protein
VAPNTNDGSDDLLVIRGGSDTHRILYREELFDEPVTVLAAEVQLHGQRHHRPDPPVRCPSTR